MKKIIFALTTLSVSILATAAHAGGRHVAPVCDPVTSVSEPSVLGLVAVAAIGAYIIGRKRAKG